MTQTLRTALLQMCSSDCVAENLDSVEQAMSDAQQQDVQLLQLPENFAQMPIKSSDQHIELDGAGEVQDFLQAKSQYYGVAVIAGSLAVRDQGGSKPYARCLVYDDGQRIAHYDKLHLYDVDLPDGQSYRESATYQAGQLDVQNHSNALVEIAEFKIGLSICYDLRFPEYYRALTEIGSQLICVPSAFTYDTGNAHWQTLLRARAIENQVFISAAAQTGTHANGRKTWGHSMLIDPWGDIIAEQQDGEGLLIAELDFTKLQSLRDSFPVLSHRRIS